MAEYVVISFKNCESNGWMWSKNQNSLSTTSQIIHMIMWTKMSYRYRESGQREHEGGSPAKFSPSTLYSKVKVKLQQTDEWQ